MGNNITNLDRKAIRSLKKIDGKIKSALKAIDVKNKNLINKVFKEMLLDLEDALTHLRKSRIELQKSLEKTDNIKEKVEITGKLTYVVQTIVTSIDRLLHDLDLIISYSPGGSFICPALKDNKKKPPQNCPLLTQIKIDLLGYKEDNE